MPRIIEINHIEELAEYGQAWDSLLDQTSGGSFFQSLAWLTAYWKHFGTGQRLRALVAVENDRPIGILPLTVLRENSSVGRLRILTYPLHNWGSFYGPIGPEPTAVLQAGLEHIHRTRRDWDVIELRWHGSPTAIEPRSDLRPTNGRPVSWEQSLNGPLTSTATVNKLFDAQAAMSAAGFQSYSTVWDYTSIVDIDRTWDEYWSERKGAWLRRFRAAEKKLQSQGELEYIRWRPGGARLDDALPRWDIYDACEQLAAHTWQAEATNGTTLSDDSVRGFLREVHEAAAAEGAVDVNFLMLDGRPAAFIYGYHWRGYIYGLRRGFDRQLAHNGAGNVLLAYTLRDSFARGDRVYDMGVGSLTSKRHFQTRLAPIMRYSHYSPGVLRAQALRLKRWWQSKQSPVFTAVDHVQDFAVDSR